MAWQKLCKDMDKGGLDVHDIGKFNQPLLGKQAWRVLRRPSYAWRSLISRQRTVETGVDLVNNTSGHWDTTRAMQTFSPEDAQRVLQIKLSSNRDNSLT
ncbi:unnamed protein product [Microthlaspi erraticum]|uniref:Reverse transcriptase zinc-binding domain-containing protein n=1 Tax=Microthlaspi erraticum TaxID=1685480 RepID=A0A6D2HSV4_9BRAS|nr:unnamed protein product [Microthlaspi erraticum]